MKKRLTGISLALILILSLFLSTAAPAMADQVDEDEPVASLSWSGRIIVPEVYMMVPIVGGDDSTSLFSVNIKKYANQPMVGQLREKNNKHGYDYILPIVDVIFSEIDDGIKVADILTYVDAGKYGIWYYWAHFEDRGEPGKGNDIFERYIWWPPNTTYDWPPLNLGPIGPHWTPWLSGSLVYPQSPPNGYPYPPTIYIGSGDVQIHITEAYIP